MNSAMTIAAPRPAIGAVAVGPARMPHRQAIRRIDLTGALLMVMPALLGASFVIGNRSIEVAAYAVAVVATLPYLGPFVTSLRQAPANLLLVLLFVSLALSTAAAFDRVAANDAVLQAKALGATAVWASI